MSIIQLVLLSVSAWVEWVIDANQEGSMNDINSNSSRKIVVSLRVQPEVRDRLRMIAVTMRRSMSDVVAAWTDRVADHLGLPDGTVSGDRDEDRDPSEGDQ